MAPHYVLNHQKNPFFYYKCTTLQHPGSETCAMKAVPAIALENVVISRLMQLQENPELIMDLVKDAAHASSVQMQTLAESQHILQGQFTQVKNKLDALVESIANRKVGVKSISKKIIELEDRKEILEGELFEIEDKVQQAKKKAVSAFGFGQRLTTFSELCEEAAPEEQRELLRQEIDQLIYPAG